MLMFPFQIPAGLLSTFYRRAVLYLFAKKAEPLIFSLSPPGRGLLQAG
jgi:hypothetical protein